MKPSMFFTKRTYIRSSHFMSGMASLSFTFTYLFFERCFTRRLINPKVTFLIHVHYEEYKTNVLRLLKKGVPPSSVIVSSSRKEIHQWALQLGMRARSTPNSLRNFGAFNGLNTDSFDDELFVHLHSKVTPQIGFLGRLWGWLLWESLTSQRFLADFASRSKSNKPCVMLLHLNRFFVEWENGWPHWEREALQSKHFVDKKLTKPKVFPAGAMFVINRQGLEKIREMVDSNAGSFQMAEDVRDGTWLHFVERYLGSGEFKNYVIDYARVIEI